MHLKTCFVWILFCSFCFQRSAAQKVSAIMGAMPEEIAALKEIIQDGREVVVGGIPFIKGRIKNRAVVLVQSGVGKVNAAMTCTLLLENFKPASVIFTGVAGGIDPAIHIGDIVIADSVVQHDFGTWNNDNTFVHWGAQNPIDGVRNPVFFTSDSVLRNLAQRQGEALTLEPIVLHQQTRTPVIRHGVIATGDQFISSSQKKAELNKTLHAQAVEMEGGAVAQVCYEHRVPFLIIRSISDLAEEEARESFAAFMKTAAKNAATVVAGILQMLPESKASQDSDFVKTEIYFGMESQGKLITEKQWQTFLDRYITPRFPDGFTVTNSYGQWFSTKTKKVVKEPSRVVVILHQKDGATEEAIIAITKAYQQQFKQEAVLRVDTKTERVSF
jgi:adenosylhomocysteine nucleosidase